MVDAITLEGRLVRLEPLCFNHLRGLVEASSGPRDTFVFTGVPNGEDEARDFVETSMTALAAGTALPFAVIDLRSGRVAGSTRYFDMQFWDWPEGSAHQRGSHLPDALEIGYTWLAAHAQRAGINTEVSC